MRWKRERHRRPLAKALCTAFCLVGADGSADPWRSVDALNASLLRAMQERAKEADELRRERDRAAGQVAQLQGQAGVQAGTIRELHQKLHRAEAAARRPAADPEKVCLSVYRWRGQPMQTGRPPSECQPSSS
jgi:hypothetical protein